MAAFDVLAYFEQLKSANVPEEQARVLANGLRDWAHFQDEQNRLQLATRGDIVETNAKLRETELRLQNEIKETELRLQNEIKDTELRLQKEIEQVRAEVQKSKYDLLKWQIGGWLALAAIMAKGFGWLGF